MTRLFAPCRSGLIGLSALAAAVLTLPGESRAKGPESVADVAEKLIDAVVNISTSQNLESGGPAQPAPDPAPRDNSPFDEFFDDFFNKKNDDGGPKRVSSLGSGFVADPSGIVVTNNHVIENADEIVVNFSDGSKLTAEVVGKDEKTDLAVLRVKPSKPLVAVRFGDSDKLRVGDWVMAIGNPFGLGGTVTVGIVSARNRDINSGPYDNYIQTDAAINRGNSGGPLFDLNGAVIGINTAIISPTGGSIGIGFAIPSEIAQHVLNQIVQYGEAKRGWVGVRIQQVTDDVAKSLGLADTHGALIAGLNDGGPAQKAGLETGDVVVMFDGREVREMRDLPRLVADTDVDKEVDVVLIRKGERLTRRITVGRLVEEAPKKASLDVDPGDDLLKKTLGLSLQPLSDGLKQRFKLTDSIQGGVVVTEVQPGSKAAGGQIEAGDVIFEIGQKRVASAAEIAARVQELRAEGRKRTLFHLAKPVGEIRFVQVDIQ